MTASGQDIKVVSFTKADRALKVSAPSGLSRFAAARAQDVDIAYPNGKSRKGYLSILYDQVCQSYIWDYTELGAKQLQSGRRRHLDSPETFASGWIPYANSQALLLVSTASGRDVTIWPPSPTRATSLDDAERKSLEEAHSQIAKLQLGFRHPPQVWAGLPGVLGRAFIWGPFEAASKKELNILGVDSGPNGNLQLTVECQWKERVILDSTYKVVSHEKLP